MDIGGKADFNPRESRVPSKLRGVMYRGEPIGRDEPSIRYHAFSRSNVDNQWGNDISEHTYLDDLRNFIKTGEPKILAYSRRGENFIGFFGDTNIPEEHLGEKALKKIFVVLSVKHQTIISGYQASSMKTISIGERQVWLR